MDKQSGYPTLPYPAYAPSAGSSSVDPAVPPPAYTPSLLVPLGAPHSQSKRYYFVQPNMISAVVASDSSVVMANQTQKKFLELFLPESYDFQTYLDTYLPSFITVGFHSLH